MGGMGTVIPSAVTGLANDVGVPGAVGLALVGEAVVGFSVLGAVVAAAWTGWLSPQFGSILTTLNYGCSIRTESEEAAKE